MLFSPSGEKQKALMIRSARRSFRDERRLLHAVLTLLFAFVVTGAEIETLENDHVDLWVGYEPLNQEHPLSLSLYSHDRGRSFAASNAVVIVPESARLTIPGGTTFGAEGDSLWVLPQSQNPALVYLGLSAENLPNVFGGSLAVALVSLEGPGHFYLWQANQFGAFEVKMNSRDGIAQDDRTVPQVGSHEHLNWGFTTNGIYRVTLQATARRNGESTNILSEPTTLTFHVLPLPAAPLTPFQQWQLENFGPNAAENVKAAGSDPDSDGQSNIAEYAFGSDPLNAASSARPTLRISNGQAILEYPRVARATDVTYTVTASTNLANAEWRRVYTGSNAEQGGSATTIQVPLGPANGNRFFAVAVELKN